MSSVFSAAIINNTQVLILFNYDLLDSKLKQLLFQIFSDVCNCVAQVVLYYSKKVIIIIIAIIILQTKALIIFPTQSALSYICIHLVALVRLLCPEQPQCRCGTKVAAGDLSIGSSWCFACPLVEVEGLGVALLTSLILAGFNQ